MLIDTRVTHDAAIEALRSRLGDRLATSESVLDLHARDESSLPPCRPHAVAFPVSTEEVAAAVRICAEHSVPVIPFGMGSSVEGHVLPVHGGVSLDLHLMDEILEVSVDDLSATVQAGVTRTVLEKRLGSEGLFFSVDPGADATLGGMAATGASGTNTVRYGTMRDNVLAMEVVLAGGRVIRTGTHARKSSAGYDLTSLLIGSEGTLGVITELTLRARPIPEAVAAAVCSFASVHDAVAATTDIVQNGIPVARCELLDATMMRAVNEHSQLDHPERPTLFLEFQGSPGSVEEDAREVEQIVTAAGGGEFAWATQSEERNRLWRARHNAYFAALGLRPGCRAITTDVCVPVSRLAEAIDAAVADTSRLPFPAPVLGHVADGNFHVLLLIDPDDAGERQAAEAVYARIVERALEAGGTCTGEHGVGLGKRSALAAEAGPSLEVMKAIKHALDPAGLLNPGKVFA
jgi:D-lactate dehydrogenase (cytochrome)